MAPKSGQQALQYRLNESVDIIHAFDLRSNVVCYSNTHEERADTWIAAIVPIPARSGQLRSPEERSNYSQTIDMLGQKEPAIMYKSPTHHW